MAVVVSVVEVEQGKREVGEKREAKGEIEELEELSAKWDDRVVTVVESEDEIPVKVPVPKGYVASGIPEERKVKTGFVIYEGKEPVSLIEGEEYGVYNADENSAWKKSCRRNQWVWVPVPDVSRIWDRESKKSRLYNFSNIGVNEKRNSIPNGVLACEPAYLTERMSYKYMDSEELFAKYGMAGMTREKLYEEIKVTLEETVKSIEKYGGYYIGRYETGNVSVPNPNMVDSKNAPYNGRPVVQRMNEKINNVSWYEAYSKMKYLGANANVKASMISGALWDETLQWLVDSGAKTYEDVVNSASWGNHYDSIFAYTTIAGDTTTKGSSSQIMVPTGSSEQNKANNVYDLAGNVYEWTLEAGTGIGYRNSCRIIRGGCCGNKGERAAMYRGDSTPNDSSNSLGVRSYFYIK